MADGGWGYGGPNQPETGVSQVLAGYAARGGQLLGARRWSDNPLTLTHLRWVGPDGFTVEAQRRPEHEATMLPEEREIWVQLALHCPVSAAPPTSRDNAAWLQIGVEPGRVAELLRALQRARASTASHPDLRSGGHIADAPTQGLPGPYTGSGSAPIGEPRSPYSQGPMGMAAPRSRPLYSPLPSLPWTPEPPPQSGPYASDPGGWNGAWQRGQAEAPEVTVLPCIEVEMPVVLGDPASADSIRDFTRDVATHFSRACKAIPQVRETRGWMHGNLMVLAARMAVAQGTRAPSRAEMEGAASMLADVLSQRTLPYTRLAFADPGAWAQGTSLPQ